MDKTRRHALVEFCMYARAIIKDVDVENNACEMRRLFENMPDEELEEESDWLDELLGK